MQYRKFGRLDWQVSALGFGAMRLPTLSGKPGPDIDEAEAARMIYRAIESGVNYVDTAYPYHQKASEPFLGRILQGGWRERVRLATKMPHWMMSGPEHFDQYFDEQLAKLQTEYVDFYLLHGLDKRSWAKLKDWDVFSWAEKRIAEGRIGHLGFSFHDDFDTFKDIVDGYDWSFCQIQYNYMDIEEQAGTIGLQYAASKGLAVVVMEPLLGGKLAARQVDTRRIWQTAPKKRKPAEWALHWLWNQPEVSVVLSGMSKMIQVEQNLKTASASRVGLLSAEELGVVDQVRETYRKLCLISCTSCQYCQPCPNDLNIPMMFELYNSGHMYGVLKEVRGAYHQWIPREKRADQCVKCQECESKCPQHLPICDLLEQVDRVFDKGMTYEEALA
jgi:predicted aldo/keto reductase-like oxidoreductase